MRQEEYMTLFNEKTGEEVSCIGTISVKRGKVRIIFKKGNIHFRLYWDQDGNEKELFHEDDKRNDSGSESE